MVVTPNATLPAASSDTQTYNVAGGTNTPDPTGVRTVTVMVTAPLRLVNSANRDVNPPVNFEMSMVHP